MTGRKQTAVLLRSVNLDNLEQGNTLEQMKSCDIETPGLARGGRTEMEHLAYQPLFPTVNKYLQQKSDKASYELHRMKVKSVKPTIDTTPPRTYGHMALNLKKKKLEEERALKIQREDNILMEKISLIMRTTGGVDNRNYYERRSLGKEKRQLELLRITKENEMILIRLSHCRPHYSVKSWHDDWIKTLTVMDQIAHYPRRRAKLQKGQLKPRKQHSGCDDEQQIKTGAPTHGAASNGNIHDQAESDRKPGKERNR